jgi:hypothetical protein
MNKAEEFNNILMQLPLLPHERAYFMTRFYENNGFLDKQDHADLAQRIQDAIEDTENTIQDYDWILKEMKTEAQEVA